MTQTFPAVAEAEIGCGGESGFLSHACSGVGVGALGKCIFKGLSRARILGFLARNPNLRMRTFLHVSANSWQCM